MGPIPSPAARATKPARGTARRHQATPYDAEVTVPAEALARTAGVIGAPVAGFTRWS
jgi:hypothetical protein